MFYRTYLTLFAAFILTQLSGCGTPSQPTAEAPKTLPKKVICIGPTATASALALGLSAQLIAVDQSSIGLPGLADTLKPVGYHRAMSAEGLLGLAPDLVIATTQAGPPVVFETLRKAGIAVEIVPAGETPDSAAFALRRIGSRFGVTDRAEKLASQMTQQIDSVAKTVSASDRPTFLICYTRGSADKLQMLGKDQAFVRIAELAGGKNAVDFEGSKALTAEAVLAANPAVLIMPKEAFEQLGRLEGLKKHPILSQTRAAKEGRVSVASDFALYGFSPISAKTVAQLAADFKTKTAH